MIGEDIYSGLDLRYARVTSEVLTNLSACCGRETSELWPFDAVTERRRTRLSNVPRNEVVVTSGFMIAPFPSGSIARSGRFVQRLSFSDVDNLLLLVLQEIKDNTLFKNVFLQRI